MKKLYYLILLLLTLNSFNVMALSLIVQGNYQVEVESNQWVLGLSLSVKEKDQKTANREYQSAINELYAKLNQVQISKDKLMTIQYTTKPWVEWENNRKVTKGFEITQKAKVKLEKIKTLQSTINKISTLKYVNIDFVHHQLTDEKARSVRAELLQKAYQDALSKVKALSSISQKKLSHIEKVQEISDSEPDGPIYRTAKLSLSQESVSSNGETSVSLVPLPISLESSLSVTAVLK